MEKNLVKLPSLIDLHKDPVEAFKNDQLNLLLSQPTPGKYVKVHPLLKIKNEKGEKVSLQYIPVDKVKYLLTRIFQNWYSEVVDYKLIVQSVCVHVRLFYTNPITGQWLHQDGVGAVGIQTDSGADATDLQSVKADGVMKALPAAESYAIKNAAEKIGNIFGAGLQKNIPDFKGAYTPAAEPSESNYGGSTESTTESKAAPPSTPKFEL